MNHDKIHALLVEYNDDLALLQWYMDRGDDGASRDIIRYLYILGDDLSRLIDSMPSSADHKAKSNLASPEATSSEEAGSEPVSPRHLGGLTLILEREYRK
jgi:hypothetical protein